MKKQYGFLVASVFLFAFGSAQAYATVLSDDLERERQSLLSEQAELSAELDVFDAKADVHEKAAAKFKLKVDEHNDAVRVYNADCNNNPVDPAGCNKYASELNRQKAALREEYDSLVAERSTLHREMSSIERRISSWRERSLAFNAKLHAPPVSGDEHP